MRVTTMVKKYVLAIAILMIISGCAPSASVGESSAVTTTPPAAETAAPPAVEAAAPPSTTSSIVQAAPPQELSQSDSAAPRNSSSSSQNSTGGTSTPASASAPPSSSATDTGKHIEITATDVAFNGMNSGDTRTTTINVTPADCKLTLTAQGDSAQWSLNGNQLTVTMKQYPSGIPSATITASKAGYTSAECYVNAYSLEYTPISEKIDHQPIVDELVRRINLLRRKSGLPELEQSQALNRAAQTRAGEATQSNWQTRYGLGTSWTTVLDEEGFAYRAADQQITSGKSYIFELMDAVDDSPMMSEAIYDTIGIGIKRSPNYGNRMVYVFIFAEEMPEGSQIDPYIELDQQHVEMKVGDKVTLNAKLQPAGSGFKEQLKWVSQDKSVVTASSNNRSAYLQAQAPGYTEIVVLTEKSGITATCTVLVVGEPEQDEEPTTDSETEDTDAPIGRIVISHENITLRVGESKQLSAKIAPASAGEGNEFSWQVYDGGEFAEISDSGEITATAEGTAYVACYSSISEINWVLCVATIIP